MNTDFRQNDAYITAPRDQTTIVRHAVAPPPQLAVTDPAALRASPEGRRSDTNVRRRHPNFYELGLARVGLSLLGVALGIAATWYIVAWIRYGRRPMSEGPHVTLSIGSGWTEVPIMPPEWVLAVTGALGLLSIALMLVGTQESNPKMKALKKRKSNKGMVQPR